MPKLKVGFIGLGLMGNPMAKNILRAKFPLSLYNRSEEKVREFKDLGVVVCTSSAEVAKNSDVVISMVTGPKEVRQVYFGKNGAVLGAKKGQIFIDMSTIGPQAAVEIGEDLENFGIQFLDAPVTGSVDRARTGELTIFIGGDEVTFKKAKPIFLAMGKDLHFMGPQGSGQAIKLVNNMIIAIGLAGLAEGVLLAERMGLPKDKILPVLEKTATLSPNMKLKLPKMVNNDFSTAFSMKNMDKDLRLALNELGNQKSRVLKLVEKYFNKAEKQGFGEEDIAAIVKSIQTNR